MARGIIRKKFGRTAPDGVDQMQVRLQEGIEKSAKKNAERAPVQAVIFDFDGVILESADIKTEAFRKLFKPFCPEHIDEIIAYHLDNEGISRYSKFRHIYLKYVGREITVAEEDLLGKRFSELVLKGILEAPYVPGALEFLNEYHSVYRLFVASGTPEDELIHIAKERGVFGYFHELHGSPKKKAEIISDLLMRYEWHPRQVVFVGDGTSDRDAADQRGIPFIARIKDKAHPLRFCPHRVFDLNALSDVIHSLNR